MDVSSLNVNSQSCIESVESLFLMIHSTHLRIHLVKTARQTLGVCFPRLVVEFIYIHMMEKNQLKSLIQNNNSYNQT